MAARLLSVAAAVVPGIGRVRAQVEPFARDWAAANAAALADSGPLWVALGDSMTQSVGARSIDGGWAVQLQRQLAAAGRPVRLVNLAVSGARVSDLVDDQLSRLAALGQRPDLVTVLIGSNDMLTKARRQAAVTAFRQLLDRLPSLVADRATVVVGSLPRPSRESNLINAMISDAADAGQVMVADLRTGGTLMSWRGSLADDLFHPNEKGYQRIARPFAAAILGTAAGRSGQPGSDVA